MNKQEYINKHGLPFDPDIGMDVFKDIEVAPDIKDFDEEFKTQNCYNGYINVMKSGTQLSFTPQMTKEIIKCRDNVLYFLINYVKIISLDDGEINFELFQYQKNMIKMIHENRFTLFNLPRQMGKCSDESTIITIRNKNTGKVEDIRIGDFYARIESSQQ